MQAAMVDTDAVTTLSLSLSLRVCVCVCVACGRAEEGMSGSCGRIQVVESSTRRGSSSGEVSAVGERRRAAFSFIHGLDRRWEAAVVGALTSSRTSLTVGGVLLVYELCLGRPVVLPR
jgi:hypothetical protein